MPGVPFLYYGDEIGMRYRAPGRQEGGYVRTGSRTPMQWGANDASGALHVSGPAESDTRAGDVTGGSYLPADPSADAPTVAAQQADTESLWHTVRSILHVKGECDALRSGATFHAIERDRVFVFERSTFYDDRSRQSKPRFAALQLPDGSYRTIFSMAKR